jgi:hypothetical protein
MAVTPRADVPAEGVPASLPEVLNPREAPWDRRGDRIVTTALGSFEVEMKRDSDDDLVEGTALGSRMVSKRFHGDLDGTSQGRMLTGMTRVDGSAGYVLIERVHGRVHGRSGTFLLQHSGILERGTPRQTIEVVPDSGSGELVGIRGRMTIQVSGDAHSYEFDYEIVGGP